MDFLLKERKAYEAAWEEGIEQDYGEGKAPWTTDQTLP